MLADTATALPGYGVALIVAFTVESAVIAVVILVIVLKYRRSQKTNGDPENSQGLNNTDNKSVTKTLSRSRSLRLVDFENFADKAQARRSETTNPGPPTQTQTFPGNDIILPGYLLLNYERDMRVEKLIAGGGGGKVSFGVLVNAEVRAKFPDVADAVVIKSITSPEGISAEDALQAFHQEVAVTK